ncbi:MAG: hypothetical protein LBC19_15510 [Tannerella sp.]|jgi:hypothetical protein|nr:hypothetical protein [Tannerella sp.]
MKRIIYALVFLCSSLTVSSQVASYYFENKDAFAEYFFLKDISKEEIPVKIMPSVFSSASVTRSGSSVAVQSGVSGSKICVVSSNDYGASYLQSADNTSSYTFTNVPANYSVTITKDNYIPYLYDNNVTIQNTTYTGGTYFINGNNFTVNNVIQGGNTNLHLEPQGSVSIENRFEIQNGSIFSIE